MWMKNIAVLDLVLYSKNLEKLLKTFKPAQKCGLRTGLVLCWVILAKKISRLRRATHFFKGKN